MTMTNMNRIPTHKCYRAGLVAVLARCAPGCRANVEAVAALAKFDAAYVVRQ